MNDRFDQRERVAPRAVVAASTYQAEAVVSAIAAVATADGRDELSELGSGTVRGAWHCVLTQTSPPPELPMSAVSPSQLAARLDDPWMAEVAVRLLAVASLADGAFDQKKVAVLLSYAEALGVDEGYLHQIDLGAQGDEATMGRDMMRQNLRSIPGIGWTEAWTPQEVERALTPYGGDGADPALAASYQRLADCPSGSLGRCFYDFYRRYGFGFPGDPDALNEHFAPRHDSTHLLSGYNTSLQGELLVSTFTATMHELNPMSGHIIPVIVSWHVGTRVNEVAKHATGAYDPMKFFVAWARGAATSLDTFDPAWSFWEAADHDLEDIRSAYAIAPLEPAFEPSGAVPASGDVHRPARHD